MFIATQRFGKYIPVATNMQATISNFHWFWVWVFVTTDGQSASLSWYKASIQGLRPNFYFRTEYGIRLTVTFFIPWDSLSDEKTGLSFVCASGPCQRSLSRSQSLGTCDRILLSQIWDFPFRRLLRLAGSRWRYSTPPPHGLHVCFYNPLARTAQKTPFIVLQSFPWEHDCLWRRYSVTAAYTCLFRICCMAADVSLQKLKKLQGHILFVICFVQLASTEKKKWNWNWVRKVLVLWDHFEPNIISL
jgi:hypothetical protein